MSVCPSRLTLLLALMRDRDQVLVRRGGEWRLEPSGWRVDPDTAECAVFFDDVIPDGAAPQTWRPA